MPSSRRHPMHLWAACALAASPIGCARYEPKPLDTQAHLSAYFGRLPDAPGIGDLAARLSAAAPAAAAFDPSDGLSLPEAEAVALFYNPDLRVARLRSGVAKAAADFAGLWEDPMLQFDAERIIESVPDQWWYGGMLALTIPLSGTPDAEKSAATAEHAAAVAGILAEEWRVRLELRRAWHEWSAARLREDEAAARLERLDALLAIVHRLEEVGELPRIESRLFDLEQSAGRIELSDLRAETREQSLALRRLMGLSPSAPVNLIPSSLPASAPTVAPVSPSAARPSDGTVSPDEAAALARNNPMLAVARHEYAVAERELNVEIRKQYPDIQIGGGGGVEEGMSRVLLGISLPIPLWNRNQRGVAEAAARREVARAAYEAELENAIAELAEARVRIESARVRRTIIEQDIAPLADQQMADARRVAELGEVDILLLLESLMRQYEARKELIDAALDESLASIDLAELLGPPADITGSQLP